MRHASLNSDALNWDFDSDFAVAKSETRHVHHRHSFIHSLTPWLIQPTNPTQMSRWQMIVMMSSLSENRVNTVTAVQRRARLQRTVCLDRWSLVRMKQAKPRAMQGLKVMSLSRWTCSNSHRLRSHQQPSKLRNCFHMCSHSNNNQD